MGRGGDLDVEPLPSSSDRSVKEVHNYQRASLGKFVWRMEDGSDALLVDSVGSSAYKKAQRGTCQGLGLARRGGSCIAIFYHWDIA